MNKLNKILLIIGVIFLMQNTLTAQKDSEMKTLFDCNIKNVGFAVTPSFGYTKMGDADVSLFNVRGGVSFNNVFSFGGFYGFSLNEIFLTAELNPNLYMDYWVAGGYAEYTLFSNRVVHLTFPLFIGGGEVEMDHLIDEVDLDIDESYFFKIEPSAKIEVNLHKFVRLNVGAGYRHISSLNFANLNNSDLSNFTVYAGIKLGLFR